MKNTFVVFLFFLTLSVASQNNQNKWAFGLSLASAKYSDTNAKTLGGSFVNQSPRINVSKYLFKNLTADVAFSTSFFDTQKYSTFDGVLRYDFGKSNDNSVPYVLLGGSFISAAKSTPTLNFGAGNTFWFSPNYGLNIQLMYKFSENKFESQFSHLYPSVGVVYSLKPRNMNRRLWDEEH